MSNHAEPRIGGFALSDVSHIRYLLCYPSLGFTAGYGGNIVWTASHLTCLEWVPVALEQSGVEQEEMPELPRWGDSHDSSTARRGEQAHPGPSVAPSCRVWFCVNILPSSGLPDPGLVGGLRNDQSLGEPWARDIWKFREGRSGGISPDVLCIPGISDGVLLGLGLWRGFLSLSDHVSLWLSPPTMS